MQFDYGLQLDEPEIMLRWAMSPYDLARHLRLKSFRSVHFPTFQARALGRLQVQISPRFSGKRNLDRIYVRCSSTSFGAIQSILNAEMGPFDGTRDGPYRSGFASEIAYWDRGAVRVELALIDPPGGPYPQVSLRLV